jgi:hypothetical protein
MQPPPAKRFLSRQRIGYRAVRDAGERSGIEPWKSLLTNAFCSLSRMQRASCRGSVMSAVLHRMGRVPPHAVEIGFLVIVAGSARVVIRR